jgi:hypothetical protein
MPREKVPGTDFDYFLVAFDAEGRERREDGRLLTEQVLKEVERRKATDVVLLSHGWNGDVPAARYQYARWLTTMLGCEADRAAMRDRVPGYRPLVIGLHWPSKAWGDEELDVAGSFTAASRREDEAPAAPMTVGDVVERYLDRLADSEIARAALQTIVTAALEDITPPTLPPEVREAYQVLDAEAGLAADGEGADPAADRVPFDAEQAYQAARWEEEDFEFGRAALGGVLAPLRMLTFWQMKRRARDFGSTGAHDLLRALQGLNLDGRRLRLHLIGHSFGCIVTSAAVTGPPGAQPVRPVDSLVLVQGAISLWSYCSSIPHRPDRRGYFARLVADELVAGPVVVTTSERDRAVGSFYPIGAGLRRQIDFGTELPEYGGLGSFGIRGPGPRIEDLPMADATDDYRFRDGTVYNLESSHVIREGGGASGAHSDINRPEVAHAVWQAMACTAR